MKSTLASKAVFDNKGEKIGYIYNHVLSTDHLYIHFDFLNSVFGPYSFDSIKEREWHIEGRYSIAEGVDSKPTHYSKGIDAWEIIDRVFTPEQQTGFDAGNVIKYVLRYEHKDGLKDLKKARDYLDRMIARMEKADEA